ncbi:MAG: MFS transporter [Candidatus Latescibacterota bacterium]
MNRNVRIMLGVSILFGLSIGIYDFLLPFYLDEVGISFAYMGAIFSMAALVMFVLRVYVGHLSDRIGRKVFYALAILGCSVANFLTPFFGALWAQTALKSLRESSAVVKETMHTVALYENAKNRFTDFIARTNGAEILFQGIGTFVGGALLVAVGFRVSFFLSALLLMGTFLWFMTCYDERNTRTEPGEATSLRDLWLFELPVELRILALSGFVFTVGLSTSHCFVMPLFFAKKFLVSAPIVAAILTLHRVFLGFPMLFTGRWVRGNLKALYIGFVIYEGVAMSVSALIPDFLPATVVWLTHDLVGASVWFPIQRTLIQRFARPEARGRQVGQVLAISSLGWVFGPLIAGFVAHESISAPFFLSGLLMIVSALTLLPLRAEREIPMVQESQI